MDVVLDGPDRLQLVAGCYVRTLEMFLRIQRHAVTVRRSYGARLR
jgi:hypothetical protein